MSEVAQRAVNELKSGAVWGLPADSAYALAADAFSVTGVRRLQALKGRSNTATPILIGRPETLTGIATDISEELLKLSEAFWPGQLTLLLRPNSTLQWAPNRDSISVRMPVNDATRQIAGDVGALVAFAASREDIRPPLTAAEGAELWKGEVGEWLDEGECDPALVSTVLDCRVGRLNVVRLGALSVAQLKAVVPAVTMMITD